MNTMDALVIVDFQNDFCPDGALPVADGNAIAAALFERGALTLDSPGTGLLCPKEAPGPISAEQTPPV